MRADLQRDIGTIERGVGAQVHVGNIGARLEYGSLRIPSTNGARIGSRTVFLNLY